MFVLSMIYCNAQITFQTNTFPDNGNVGIGTISPSEKLEVRGKVKANSAEFTNSPSGVYNFSNNSERVEKSRVFSGGTLFDAGNLNERSINFYDFPQSNMNSVPRVWLSIMDRNYNDRLRFWADMDNESVFRIYNKNQDPRFVFSENSNNAYLTLPAQNSYVMIGTNTYTDNGENYKLNVNGKIRALGVKVYTDWADYVFEEGYELSTLLEVESYIKEHGHLKDIPGENEVEEKGVELGEMNKLLLQKIEELTLYLIQKEKEYQVLNKEIKVLKEQLEEVKK